MFIIGQIVEIEGGTEIGRRDVGVWQGVAMDSLKFHPGSPCPTLLRPADGPSLRWSYECFRGGPPVGRMACGHLLALWIPHALSLW
jgi:hypothetical protein